MKGARFCLVLVLSAWAPAALATWDEGDPYKMHWPQLPDLSITGMDVNATQPFILADDFRCVQSGPITAIHVWGSWRDDQVDPNPAFILSIHSDIPAGQEASYSMPGTTLWTRTFIPGEYDYRIYALELSEGWLDPPDDYVPPPADTICYQYNFPVDPLDAFYQTNETIYWVDVQVLPSDPIYVFGWKTAVPDLRWNDDACWTTGEEPDPTGGWVNLVYPPLHPLGTQTLDLAFVIQGQAVRTNPICPKWIQWPDCDRGLDVESWTYQQPTQAAQFVADDWLCDGRPVHGIRWWGSYIGWQTNTPDPVAPPPAPRPLGFLLSWYYDIPASGTNYSQPDGLITNFYYALSPYGETNRDQVLEQYYCTSPLEFLGSNVFEHEYSYYIVFTNEPWLEKASNVYWLGIAAVYAATPTQYVWGWKTTSPQWNWNDDAVWSPDTVTWFEMHYPPPGWEGVTNHPYQGMSVNMAFELLTHICPSRCTKWSQPPDMVMGMDMYSFSVGGTTVFLRADDFISDGRPITDIHWWGSYRGWMSTEPGSPTNPIPPPVGISRPIGFNLSWHLNDPISCLPAAVLTNVFVPISNCYETYYGTVVQEWNDPDIFEHEYQYYVDLLDAGLDTTPWMETNGVPYWLNIQAVFGAEFTGQYHSGWGWKITPGTTGCYSAVSLDGVSWTNDTLPPPHPNAESYFDLAFELTTTNLPRTNLVIHAVFTNIFRTNLPSGTYMWSTGYCGCGRQVLQVSSNLVAGTWSDVFTNPTPRAENLWRGQAGATAVFYRVLQVQ
ncbi:MAG TPA: hypothetical protein EYP62_05425 [Kiritimatiellae bacterium]|nr:hypothetical protein [Kiritimatiellia bacterium]